VRAPSITLDVFIVLVITILHSIVCAINLFPFVIMINNDFWRTRFVDTMSALIAVAAAVLLQSQRSTATICVGVAFLGVQLV